MSLKQKAIHGLGWTFTNQVSVQVVRFGVSVLLARMLSPHDFGLVGMITVFIALGSAFIDGGMASSLIRTQEATHADFSTVFFMNVGVGVVAYVLLFFTAPLVASFFHQPELVAIVRVYAISFIVSALTIVQNTRLTKQLEFKKQFLVSLPSFVVSGVVGLVCAYSGMGVWSLVWMHLAQTSFSSAQLWLRSDWRPSFIFDSGRFKHHFSFGYKLTLSALLERLYQNITAILIGRYFSVSQLGFYSRAQSMKQLPVDSISAALNKVTYPLFASIQDDNPRLKSVYRRLMQQVLFWLTPSLVLASVLAEPIFRWLLTAKWLPAVPYFQIVCFLGVMYPIHAYNLNVLNVKGRSDLFFRLEVIKKVIGFSLIIVGLQFGIYGLLFSEIVINIICFFVNSYYSGRLIDYSSWAQLRDIAPIFFLSLLIGTIAFLISLIVAQEHDLIRIAVPAVVSLGVYFAFAHVVKFEPYSEFRKLISSK